MKIKYIIFGAIVMVVLSGVFFLTYEFKNSSEAIIARNNLQNIKEIEVGMDTSQVLTIMGHPIDRREHKGELIYDYDMPSGLSLQCQIIFDSSGLATFISPDLESLK